jgi:hypothetical protein
MIGLWGGAEIRQSGPKPVYRFAKRAILASLDGNYVTANFS